MPLDTEERRPGEDGCSDGEQHRHQDPDEAQHERRLYVSSLGDRSLRAPSRAVFALSAGSGCRGSESPPHTRYARPVQEIRRFEGPSDLHLHSTHSDGTESPAQVMAAAHRHGLRTAALTDHDTTSGWAEAAEAATSLGMTFLPGMELSARHEWRSVHVLAYLVDPDEPGLRAMTDRIRSSRLDRARLMADRIGRDYDLDWDDIVAQTTVGATVGRPAHRRRPRRARARARPRGGLLEHPEPPRRVLRRALRARSGHRRSARHRGGRRRDHRASCGTRGRAAEAAARPDAVSRPCRIRARASREPRKRHPDAPRRSWPSAT